MEIDYKFVKEIECKQGAVRAVRFSGTQFVRSFYLAMLTSFYH